MQNEVCVLTEKFSAASTLRREKMRIISGITALNLIKEKRFAEASVYARSLIEIKDCSIEEVIRFLPTGFVPPQTQQMAEIVVKVAQLLSKDPDSIEESEIDESKNRLVELLDVLGSKPKV
jgi:hypothetical protein